jgi:hypothetical protein
MLLIDVSTYCKKKIDVSTYEDLFYVGFLFELCQLCSWSI